MAVARARQGFASDDAPRVQFPSSCMFQEDGHVSDEAQSERSVSKSKSLIEHDIVTSKRFKVTMPHPEELFGELYIDPIIDEVCSFQVARDLSEIH